MIVIRSEQIYNETTINIELVKNRMACIEQEELDVGNRKAIRLVIRLMRMLFRLKAGNCFCYRIERLILSESKPFLFLYFLAKNQRINQ